MGNQIKTTILLAVLTAFIVWVGQLMGGRQGMVIALLFAAGMNFFSYWYSDKIVLRMYRAREATPAQAPEIYRMVQELTRRAGLPMTTVSSPSKSNILESFGYMTGIPGPTMDVWYLLNIRGKGGTGISSPVFSRSSSMCFR